MDFTTRLSLNKPNPDPVTGDVVDVAKLNENFDKLDSVIGAMPVTSGTRPATPFHGQFIRETDTRRFYAWNATQSAWDQLFSASTRARSPMDIERDTAGQTFYNGYLTGEANPRMTIRGDGMFLIGPGNAAQDVNLYRRAANHLGTDDSFQAGGFCSGAATESVRTTNFPNITAEVVVQTVTFNAISGVGYMIYGWQHFQSSVVNDIIRTRLRYAAGASVSTGGTLIAILNPNCSTAARGDVMGINKLWIAPSTGQFTIGLTMERVGTGIGQAYGDPNQAYNILGVTGA